MKQRTEGCLFAECSAERSETFVNLDARNETPVLQELHMTKRE